MTVALWITAALLAAALLGAGLMKLTQPQAKLVASGQGWAEDFPEGVVKGIGVLEVLAAVGLVVPALLGVATSLVPLAASGVVLLMGGAALTHARRGEWANIAPTLVLAGLALFVAVNRFGAYSF